MFALKLRGSFQFACVTNTLEQTKSEVNEVYYRWCGMRPKGSESTYEEFMENRTIVELTIQTVE